MSRMNMGVCSSNRKSFDKVIQHFIYVGDETYMQECENGTNKVIGSKNWKNNERKDQESRVSITMYQDWSVTGITGPNIFLLEGKNLHDTYSNNFLLTNI